MLFAWGQQCELEGTKGLPYAALQVQATNMMTTTTHAVMSDLFGQQRICRTATRSSGISSTAHGSGRTVRNIEEKECQLTIYCSSSLN